jgi:hypothetical protein
MVPSSVARTRAARAWRLTQGMSMVAVEPQQSYSPHRQDVGVIGNQCDVDTTNGQTKHA